MKQYKFDRNYLNLLIKNKDKLLDNNLVILVTYIEVLQDKLKAYKNVIKEAIEYTKSHFKEMVADEEAQILLDILNKVGSDK